MAYKHYIQRVQEMDPKPGNKFFTTYYNASKEENKLLLEFVTEYIEGMKQDLLSDPIEAANVYGKEIGGNHTRLDKSAYEVHDVMLDLYEQLKSGRNATKSMIDRWNDAMAGFDLYDTQIDIELVLRPTKNRFPNNLFEEVK